MNNPKEAIKEFESMINLAELKALSKLSLEKELTQEQYNKMMELGIKLGLKEVY